MIRDPGKSRAAKFIAAYKQLTPELEIKIVRCPDPSMWYSGMVGQMIKPERFDTDGIWAREPAGYLNVIRFEDVIP